MRPSSSSLSRSEVVRYLRDHPDEIDRIVAEATGGSRKGRELLFAFAELPDGRVAVSVRAAGSE